MNYAHVLHSGHQIQSNTYGLNNGFHHYEQCRGMTWDEYYDELLYGNDYANYDYHHNNYYGYDYDSDQIQCSDEYPLRQPVTIDWNNPIQIQLDFGVNPVIFNRLSVKIKTGVKGSNIRFITGTNFVFECEVLDEKTDGEDLLQVLKCGVEWLARLLWVQYNTIQ